MQVRLDKVRDQPFRWDETEEISTDAFGDQRVETVGPARWRGRITHAPPGFLLEAEVLAEARLACDRCLVPFQYRLDGEAQLLILLRGTGEDQGERELDESDLGVIEIDEELLDLDPILYELLQLQMPMKPLCRTDCQGLCPSCGADRNEVACGCAGAVTDPRWAALAALRPNSDD